MRRLAGARRGRLPGRSAPARRRGRRCRATRRRGARTWSGSSQLRWNRMKPSGSASRKKSRSSGVERRAGAAEDGARHGGSRLDKDAPDACAASARRSRARPRRHRRSARPGCDSRCRVSPRSARDRGEAQLAEQIALLVASAGPIRACAASARAHRAELQAIALPPRPARRRRRGGARALGSGAAVGSAPAWLGAAGAALGGGVAGVACAALAARAAPAVRRRRRSLGRRRPLAAGGVAAAAARLARGAAAASPAAAAAARRSAPTRLSTIEFWLGHVHAAGVRSGRLRVGCSSARSNGTSAATGVPLLLIMRERPDADRRK